MTQTFIEIALSVAKNSKSKTLKVGAVLVRDKRILSFGYNGLPAGYQPDVLEDENGITLPDVIHAELNCILNAAKEGIKIEGATLFVTHSPCRHCAAFIKQAGIKEVVYIESYRDNEGVKNLREYGVWTHSAKEYINLKNTEFVI